MEGDGAGDRSRSGRATRTLPKASKGYSRFGSFTGTPYAGNFQHGCTGGTCGGSASGVAALDQHGDDHVEFTGEYVMHTGPDPATPPGMSMSSPCLQVPPTPCGYPTSPAWAPLAHHRIPSPRTPEGLAFAPGYPKHRISSPRAPDGDRLLQLTSKYGASGSAATRPLLRLGLTGLQAPKGQQLAGKTPAMPQTPPELLQKLAGKGPKPPSRKTPPEITGSTRVLMPAMPQPVAHEGPHHCVLMPATPQPVAHAGPQQVFYAMLPGQYSCVTSDPRPIAPAVPFACVGPPPLSYVMVPAPAGAVCTCRAAAAQLCDAAGAAAAALLHGGAGAAAAAAADLHHAVCAAVSP